MKSTYRDDIDGLRALSIILVVFFHFFPEKLSGGFIGVDIFFVISGFLITGIIYNELSKNSFSLINFFYKRATRILPSLTVMLFFTTIACHLLLFSQEYKAFGKLLSANSIFLTNFSLYTESGYFDSASEFKPLLHLWSLSIEEQFYLLFPMLFVFFFKKKIEKTYVVFSLVTSFLLCASLKEKTHFAFYMPFTRSWELLAGSYLFLISKNQKKTMESIIRKEILSIIGIIIILTFCIFFDKINKYPGLYSLIPVAGAILIIGTGKNTFINKKVFSFKPLIFVGKISYPLYLWHWPLLSLGLIISNGVLLNNHKLIIITISIILSTITYFFIEKPIQKKKGAPLVAISFILINVSLGVFGLVILKNNGFESRAINEKNINTGDNPASQHVYKDLIPCKDINLFKNTTAEFCYAKSASPEFAIIGDSHAIATGYGVIAQENLNGLFISFSATLPFNNYVSYNKNTHNKKNKIKSFQEMHESIKILSSLESIKHIIIHTRGPMYLEGNGYGEELKYDAYKNWVIENNNKNNKEFDHFKIFIEEYSKIIEDVIKKGKKFTFIIDVPELGVDPNSCVFRPGGLSQPSAKGNCIIDRKDYEIRNMNYQIMVKQLEKIFPEINIFNPEKIFCDDSNCYGIIDNKIIYYDDDHLNTIGASIFAKEFKVYLSKFT